MKTEVVVFNHSTINGQESTDRNKNRLLCKTIRIEVSQIGHHLPRTQGSGNRYSCWASGAEEFQFLLPFDLDPRHFDSNYDFGMSIITS